MSQTWHAIIASLTLTILNPWKSRGFEWFCRIEVFHWLNLPKINDVYWSVDFKGLEIVRILHKTHSGWFWRIEVHVVRILHKTHIGWFWRIEVAGILHQNHMHLLYPPIQHQGSRIKVCFSFFFFPSLSLSLSLSHCLFFCSFSLHEFSLENYHPAGSTISRRTCKLPEKQENHRHRESLVWKVFALMPPREGHREPGKSSRRMSDVLICFSCCATEQPPPVSEHNNNNNNIWTYVYSACIHQLHVSGAQGALLLLLIRLIHHSWNHLSSLRSIQLNCCHYSAYRANQPTLPSQVPI